MPQSRPDPFSALKKLILTTPLDMLKPVFVIDQARTIYGIYNACTRADLKEMVGFLARMGGEADGSKRGEIVQLAVEMGF